MTKDEMKKVMEYFKTAYKRFYEGVNMRDVLIVWYDFFEDEDPRIVKIAAKNYVKSNSFPPTIADIVEQIALIKSSSSDSDMWAMIHNAVARGLYHAVEEFNKLPPECQAFIGSPSALKDLAQTDTGTLNTVVKGQFLKRIVDIREHRNVQNGLPAEVRQAIAESKQRLLKGGTQ